MNGKEQHIRVFDKIEKIMITDEQMEGIPLLKVTNKGILKLDPTHKENLWQLIPFSDRHIVMYGSGIPDAGGEEIYEGMRVEQVCTLTGDQFAPGVEKFEGKVKHYEGIWVIDNGIDAVPLWSEHRLNYIITNYVYVYVSDTAAAFMASKKAVGVAGPRFSIEGVIKSIAETTWGINKLNRKDEDK